MKIAITGGIGSGKSYVCSLLKTYGIDVYDCDSQARRIMLESEDVKSQIIDLIGSDSYIDGKLNKSLISAFLLSSAANAELINNIVHPAVAKDFLSSGFQIMECALLFSSGFDKLVDNVVCVSAPYELRLQRVMHRDGISVERAETWIKCQMSQEELTAKSDYVIYNDGVAPLQPQLDVLIERFRLLK